jgi:ankyrin repeat protein
MFPTILLDCRWGHSSMVKYLLELGVNCEGNAFMLLSEACQGNCHLNVVKVLMNSLTFDKNYLTYQLCVVKQLEIAKCLVNYGANPCGKTLLLNACSEGRLDLVKYYLSFNTDDINIHTSLLQISCRNGHLNVVKYLVEKGIDIRNDDDLGLKEASLSGHVHIIRYLLESWNYLGIEKEIVGKILRLNLSLPVTEYLSSYK